jgi:enolase-phosphatase E1
MIKQILTDIEGTTTSIDFVHKTLFPYARERLVGYLAQHRAEEPVAEILTDVAASLKAEHGQQPDTDDCAKALVQWIDEDRKHPALKKLQGLIWEHGYRQGDFTGHVYPDVPGFLKAWATQGYRLAVYSSGSEQAQKLLFGHSSAGDLTPYFSTYYDTRMGAKKQTSSYAHISDALECEPGDILFLSDSAAELAAAREAGLAVMQLCRPGVSVEQNPPWPQARDFQDVDQWLQVNN